MSRRILLVSANWMGDVLFSTPAIRAVRKKYPDSFIACLAPARVKNILQGNPHVNEVMVYDDRAPLLAFWHTLPLVSQLKKRNFDTAILFHNSSGKASLTALAGIKERIGFGTPGRKRDLTLTVPPAAASLHRIDMYLCLLKHAGISADGRQMEYSPKPEAQASLQKMLGQKMPYAVLHAGGNWDLKRWPVDSFVEWIRLWRKEYGKKVILCGTDSEIPLADSIRSHFSKDEVMSLCGKTSFDELAFLLKNAELLISNDSGPIHLAATQKTKIVGLFGPTLPEITGPVSEASMKILRKDVGCETPCYYRSCHYRVCMDWLKPEEVFEQTRELMRA